MSDSAGVGVDIYVDFGVKMSLWKGFQKICIGVLISISVSFEISQFLKNILVVDCHVPYYIATIFVVPR